MVGITWFGGNIPNHLITYQGHVVHRSTIQSRPCLACIHTYTTVFSYLGIFSYISCKHGTIRAHTIIVFPQLLVEYCF